MLGNLLDLDREIVLIFNCDILFVVNETREKCFPEKNTSKSISLSFTNAAWLDRPDV